MRISDWSSDVCSSDLNVSWIGSCGRPLPTAVKWSPDFPDLQVRCRPVNRTSSRRALAGRPADRLADRSDGAPSGPLQDRRSPRLHLTYSVCSRHRQRYPDDDEIGRAHVCTPVTNAHLVSRLLLAKKK